MSNHKNNCQALAIAVLTGTPVIIWGLPGQGKTAIIEAMAESYGMHMETVIASISEPSDFGGLPVIDEVEVTEEIPAADGSVQTVVKKVKTVARAPLGWAQRLAFAGTGIVFYDEISTAPPAVQAALLRPLLSGWVGDLKLPDGVVSIAAANPSDVAADGWDLAPPMANRFVHLNWELDASTVREGFTSAWPQVQFPQIDPVEHEKHRQEIRILLGVFLGSRSEILTVMPDSAENSGKAWPSPRSWEMAGDLLATARAARVGSTVETMLVQGAVGPAAAGEFLTFLANMDLPDPEDLLKDCSTWVVPSDRPDQIYAIAASVWAATKNNNTKERWIACGEVLAKIADAGSADIAFTYARQWSLNRAEGAMPSVNAVRALAEILNELNALTAAG